MVNRKINIESERFKEHIRQYELGLITQKEIADQWGVTSSYISIVFLETLKGKPIKNKQKNDERNAKKVLKLLKNKETVEDIMSAFPNYFSGEDQFKRWVKNNIKEDVVILNNSQKEKEVLDKKIITDVKLGYSTNVILKKYELTRSQLRAVVYRETGEKSLKRAREKLNEED